MLGPQRMSTHLARSYLARSYCFPISLLLIGACGGPSDPGAPVPQDAAVEAAPEASADGCPPITVCTGACVEGRGNITTVVNGCTMSQCCVPLDGGGTDAPDACRPLQGCIYACTTGSGNVMTVVDGCPVLQCCVLLDGGTSDAADACPPIEVCTG